METTSKNPRSFKNKLVITLICYLCYFYTANIILITGPLMKPLSEYFNNSNIGFAFTFINFAMWFAIFIIGFLMNKFAIKPLLIIAVLIGILSSLITYYYPCMLTLKILFTCVGFASGLFMAISSYMVVHIYYRHRIRAMNVILTDFFFSFGGAIIPILATYLIINNFHWNTIYLLLQIIALGILILTFFADFSVFNRNNNPSEKHSTLSFSSWGFSLYCIAIAAFLFLLAQLTMTSYAQSYFQDVLHWGAIDASKPLSYFWIAQCIGLFLSPLVTYNIPLKRILPTSMIIANISLAIIAYIPDLETVLKAAIIFGLFNCYIYAGLLAFGTFQIFDPPPTLITTILLFGTTGTALSTTTGAFIKKYCGLTAIMHTVVILYVVAFILIVLSVIYSKELKKNI